MKISIITPTFNRTTYLNQTIESIVTQKGDFELEYIIQDGGSGQELIDILEKWKRKIDNNQIEIGCKKLTFNYFIEKDNGMYDAINKGFEKATGEIMAWLNSDDMYHPYALNTVSQIFKKFSNVQWITGIPNSYNSFGCRSGFDKFPEAYSRKYIQDGFYDVKFVDYGFNWIQQESTFWNRDLWEKIGSKISTKTKYASDFYLWQSFAKHADLVRVDSFLGGYRSHEDQITASPELYTNELPDRSNPPNGLRLLKKTLDSFSITRKLFFNKRKGSPFMNILKINYNHLIGRVIMWSFAKNDWIIFHKAIV